MNVTSGSRRVYQRLSGQDAAFLSFEGEGRPMHIGALALVAAGPWKRDDGSLDSEGVLTMLVERAKTIPGMDKRLARTPLGGWPVWVRNRNHNWRANVLLGPAVETKADVQAVAEAQMASHLDRRLPLWKIMVLPGLDGGSAFAVLFIAHHAFVDGIAGMDLITRFLDGVDKGSEATLSGGRPSDRRLAVDEVLRWALLPVMLGAKAVALARDGERRERVSRRGIALVRTCVRLLTPGPRSVLQGANEGERRVMWFAVPERPLLLARRPLLGSPNDMVLAAVSQALAGLRGHGPSLNTRAAIPVSLRKRENRHDMGNHIGLLLTPLEVPAGEAGARVTRIGRHTSVQKARGDAEGYDVLTELTGWTGQWSQRLLHWLAGRLHSYGVLITSVPGPSRGYTLGGAAVQEMYPLVPLFWGQAMSVAVIRYRGSFRIGVTASWPERGLLEEFARGLEDAFAALAKGADQGDPDGEKVEAAGA